MQAGFLKKLRVIVDNQTNSKRIFVSTRMFNNYLLFYYYIRINTNNKESPIIDLTIILSTFSENKLLKQASLLEISLFFSLKLPLKPSLILVRWAKNIDTSETLCQLWAKNVKNKKRSMKSVRYKSKIRIPVFQKMLKVRFVQKKRISSNR